MIMFLSVDQALNTKASNSRAALQEAGEPSEKDRCKSLNKTSTSRFGVAGSSVLLFHVMKAM